MGILEEKKRLRAECTSLRERLTADQRAIADELLCRHVEKHPAFLAADLILSFCATKSEPNFAKLFHAARARGIPVAFPRCEGHTMTFHIVKGLDELLPSRFGIKAPAPDAPKATPSASTLCILPALAATKDGKRLGYGGGFYDRFLATFEGVTLLPIYSLLLLSDLPQEGTDIPVQFIITEKGVEKPRA